jgi:carbonic anhydrase
VQGGTRFAHPGDPQEALSLLVEGNRRHLEGGPELRDHSPVAEDAGAEGQRPFAAVIACADSRVSPNRIFDVERGNLFVSRVAGNSVDIGTLGSTEYAVAVLGVKLVVVLGHSDCGAVTAAIEVINGTASYPPDTYGAIGPLVESLVPAVRDVPAAERTLPNCVSANARVQGADLASRGPIIKPAVEEGRIAVVAAVYDLRTGQVSFI